MWTVITKTIYGRRTCEEYSSKPISRLPRRYVDESNLESSASMQRASRTLRRLAVLDFMAEQDPPKRQAVCAYGRPR